MPAKEVTPESVEPSTLAKVAIFFDHFGVLVFAFLIGVGLRDLTKNIRKNKWVSWSILIIGILGIIVDGGLILTNWI